MSDRLKLALLGHPQVLLGDAPIADWRYKKSLALLCYLALTGRDHARETLFGLLWGETSEANAKGNLRKSLTELRGRVGPYLTITRQAVGFDRDAAYWLDVEAFESGAMHLDQSALHLERLQEAVALYRGDFLEGFYVHNAPAFEDWALAEGARLRELVLEALYALARHYTVAGAAGYTSAVHYTTRIVALEPWREEAHRGLMRLYAQAGRRGAALAQYETCRRVLAEELGVEPGPETVRLYEQIRDGELQALQPLPATPEPGPSKSLPLSPVLTAEEVPEAPRPLFVGRERGLARLNAYFDQALAGQGQVVFITGGPGRGKTALQRAFAHRAMETQPELLAAVGSCNAYSGVGDPYLPFREVLGALTGDVTAALSREHARRLWAAIPLAAQALLHHGPYLIDSLVPGPALLSRSAATAARDGWLEQLQEWVAREREEQGHLQQSALCQQYTNALRALAAAHPLLLLLDDLQWADAGSIGLLFHLGRRLGNTRILVVGTYRPEEVAITRDGEPHPLQELLTEFQRRFGDVTLDLTQADATEGRRFVDRFLDTVPNRLSAAFRDALHRHTGGHALFTIELLRAMQERGDLVQDADGLWIEGQALDWATLPARVEAVIEKRMERLDQDLRDLLAVASVEGERFTAQAVAQVEGVSERQVLRALSSDLGPGGQRLVWQAEETRIAGMGRFLSRFRFAHALFQEYLYSRLGAGERRLLHGEVAAALEGLYGDQSGEIAVELAHHYDAAGHRQKALEYMVRAGDQALPTYANAGALRYYRRALELLERSPDGSDTGQTPGAADLETKTAKAWRLRALRGLGAVYYRSSQIAEAEACYREAIALGQEIGLAARELVGLLWWLGVTLFNQDRHAERVPVGEQGLALLGADTESAEAVLMYITLALGYSHSGNTEKRREYAYRAASLLPRVRYAEGLTAAHTVIIVTCIYDKRIEEALHWAETLAKWAQAHQDLRSIAWARLWIGGILMRTGDLKGALVRIKLGLAVHSRIGDDAYRFWFPRAISDVLFALGDLPNAEAYALRCRRATHAVGSARFSALAYLSLGRIYGCQGAEQRAVAAFQTGLRYWRKLDRKGGKAWAAYALGRLRLAQGDRRRARRWFQAALALVLPEIASGRQGHLIPEMGLESIRPEFYLWASLLGGLEEACDNGTAFRAFCRRLREAHPGLRVYPFEQWHLEPTDTKAAHAPPLWDDLPAGSLADDGAPSSADTPPHDWAWHDPLGDCSYAVQNGLVLRAANGRHLWHVNLSAPRLLRAAPQGVDWVAQTSSRPAAADRPTIGGLLLWQDQQNYLRVDRGLRGPQEIAFEGCLANEDVIIGRGRLAPGDDGRVHLRLEREGDRVRALCSGDGEQWFTVGSVEFPVEAPLQVGLHAIGSIDRTVYPGSYPDGTAIRFESFTVRQTCVT